MSGKEESKCCKTISKNSSSLNILVLTYWSYKEGLIQSYTLPYIYIISRYLNSGKIILVTLEKNDLEMSKTESQTANELLERYNIIHHPLKYRPLSIGGGFKWLFDIVHLKILIRRYHIDFIHAWCTPAGLIGFVLSKLTSKPLVIDSFEPHAEAMVENGVWKKGGLSFKFLFSFEKLQAKHAWYIIAPNSGMYDYSRRKYGVELNSFSVKPACVDLEMFKPGRKEELRTNLGIIGEVTCVYAGKIGGIYLDKELFDFFKRASLFWKGNFKVLLMTNESDEVVDYWAKEANLDPGIISKRFVPFEKINEYLAAADFGITFVKPVPTKKYCTPIKDGEYWATGLPVVITKDISDDSKIIEQNNTGYVLKSLNEEEYDKALVRIDQLIRNTETSFKIRKIAKNERGFQIAEKVYKKIYG